ncbi:ATP synthase subunit C lysine N-methyltransferase-like isoform X2 [Ambystoma mexicanum]|uniref:ATP synthase subunit C lysine N-methyltransferase-like isoform X2 n=1 Tax=Ambystoma mexicanum TaxID=8296 RepID=UPI0037E89F7D
MEDSIDILLLYKRNVFLNKENQISHLDWIVSGAVASAYGLWAMFVLPGFRKVPFKLKVPFLPSSQTQCENVTKLLKGRRGRLVDLGSGDGRLVIAAASMGFHCTGYELNPILLSYAKTQARWRGFACGQATFLKQNFWTMEALEHKLSAELPENARVISCRFPFPHWTPTCSEGSGLDQVWAYDMQTLKQTSLDRQTCPGFSLSHESNY